MEKITHFLFFQARPDAIACYHDAYLPGTSYVLDIKDVRDVCALEVCGGFNCYGVRPFPFLLFTRR